MSHRVSGARAKGPALAILVSILGALCHQPAYSWKVRVAVDPPCFDNANRYVDCGNGTVTDTVTNLVWLKDASCAALPALGGSELANFENANQAALLLHSGICGLTDGSASGDWRLPTEDEWIETIARAFALGCRTGGAGTPPSLTDDAGTGCLATGSTSFSGVENSNYWSATTVDDLPGFAWRFELPAGADLDSEKTVLNYVWPVRSRR